MRVIRLFVLFIYLLLPFFLVSQENNDSIYLFVDQPPEFSGGMSGIAQYFGQALTYPEQAVRDSIEGKVYVGFVVEIDGSLSNVKLLRGIGGGCDQEAIRVVSSMPSWSSGKFKGNPVRVSKTLPIKFSLAVPPPNQTKIYLEADTLPSFEGGDSALRIYIARQIAGFERPENPVTSTTVNVIFVVETDGSISNAIVKESVGYEFDLKAVSIVQHMPRWKPGKIGNTNVRVGMMLPVDFNVYTVVESMPEYPGGMSELLKFIAVNLKYPPQAKNQGIQGRVFINFVVEGDGSVSNVKVLQGIGGGCDEEAVRVIKMMPKWKPGVQKGEPISVSYNLPVKFTLQRQNH